MLLHGWRRALLAFAAGLLATLGLAPVSVPAVGFLSFPVLVWLLDGASGRRVRPRRSGLAGFRIGWCFGFGYSSESLVARRRRPPGRHSLPVGAAARRSRPAHGAGGLSRPRRRRGAPCLERRRRGLFALAAAFAGFEWLRGTVLTGFTWNELGVLAAPVPLLMGSLSLIGLHGLTILAVFVFSLPALLAGAPGGRALTAAFGVRFWHSACRLWRLAPVAGARRHGADVALRIVQPAILQSEKWDPAEADANFDKLLSLTSGGERRPRTRSVS